MTVAAVDINHYTYRVSWSRDDGEYVGTCVELPSLSWLADTTTAALVGIEQLVAEEVAGSVAASGEDLPTPLSDRPYSGKFLVRVSPALHRRLAARAAEEQVSLNRYVEEALAGSA